MRSGIVTRSVSRGVSKLNHRKIHPYILTIIDMQESFITARDPQTIHNVQRLVNKAILDRAYIVVAQYRRAGRTLEPIKGLVDGYRHHTYAIADRNDKSGAIHRKLVLRGLNDIPRMYICGVNLDACVHDTVYGLRHKYHGTIYIVKSACNSNYPEWAGSYIVKMSKLGNVLIKE